MITQAYVLLSQTIIQMREEKPNDRSELDRVYAVTITELEKALAYFSCYGPAFGGNEIKPKG